MQPLCSSSITESSSLRVAPPLYSVSALRFSWGFHLNRSLKHQNDRFPGSTQPTVYGSRYLYAGRRWIGNQVTSQLIPESLTHPSFDDIVRYFDTSSVVHFRSSPIISPDTVLPCLFPKRSLPWLFTTAAPGRFETSSWKPIPRGLPSSARQLFLAYFKYATARQVLINKFNLIAQKFKIVYYMIYEFNKIFYPCFYIF